MKGMFMGKFEKKYVAVFAVDNTFETLRLYADNADEAKDVAISVYEDYIKAGFIKKYSYIGVKLLKE